MQEVCYVMSIVAQLMFNTFTAIEDYQPVMLNLTFGEFDITRSFQVNLVDDDVPERTEQFGIRIIIPPEVQQLGVSLGSPSELTFEISDDDCKLLT